MSIAIFGILAGVTLLFAGLGFMVYDAMFDPDGEARQAALRDFGEPRISRFGAAPKQVAIWRSWVSTKRAWASEIQNRQWRRVNLEWCDYFERRINKAEKDWHKARRVEKLAAEMRRA